MILNDDVNSLILERGRHDQVSEYISDVLVASFFSA